MKKYLVCFGWICFLAATVSAQVPDVPFAFPVWQAPVFPERTFDIRDYGAQAIPYLNQIRTRAGLEALSGLSQAEFRLAMEQERRVEFAFENQRWFDLIRTDRYLSVLRAKGLNVQNHHVLYLIPQRELDLNGALQQNPGY